MDACPAMSRVVAELERLARAINQLEQALEARERRHAEALAAARRQHDDETAAMAERVEHAIDRLETMLGGD